MDDRVVVQNNVPVTERSDTGTHLETICLVSEELVTVYYCN